MSTDLIRQKTNQNIRQKASTGSIKRQDHAEINDLIADEIDNISSVATSGIRDIYTADTATHPTANGQPVSPTNPAVSVTRIAKAAAGQTGDLVFTNIKKADGTAHADITVTAAEVDPAGDYDRVELRYNKVADTWTKEAIEKRKGDKGDAAQFLGTFTTLPTALDGEVGDVWRYVETISGVTTTYDIIKKNTGWDLDNMIRVTGDKGNTPMTYYPTGEPLNTLGSHGDIARWTDANGDRWETVKIGLEWDLAGKYLAGEGFNSGVFVEVVWAANTVINAAEANKHILQLGGATTIDVTANDAKAGIIILKNPDAHDVTFTGLVQDAIMTTEDVVSWLKFNNKVVFSITNFGGYVNKKYASTIPPYENAVAGGAAEIKDGLILDGSSSAWYKANVLTVVHDNFIPVKSGATLHNQLDSQRVIDEGIFGGNNIDWEFRIKEYDSQKNHLITTGIVRLDHLDDRDVNSVVLTANTKYIKGEVYMRNFVREDFPQFLIDYAIFSVHQNYVGKTVRWITLKEIAGNSTDIIENFTAKGTKKGSSIITIAQPTSDFELTAVCDVDDNVKIYARNKTASSLNFPAQKLTVLIQNL